MDAEAAAPVDSGMDVEAEAACVQESPAAFCARHRKDCGVFNGGDNCGAARQVMCGICADATATTCGGGGTLNVCAGDQPINRAQGGIITSNHPADIVGEEMGKAFDNNVMTKWISKFSQTPWIAYQFPAGARYAINAYSVTSANDFPGRDPMNWRLEGSDDGLNWHVVDTQAGQTFASRFQTNSYSFTNTTAYPVYQFVVTANAGDGDTQLAEIQLFGDPAPVVDASVPDSSVSETSTPDVSSEETPDSSGE
jgi:hypothetical protein